MHITRDDDRIDPIPSAPEAALLQQVDAMEEEIEMLRTEVSTLRRRDETLNFYMRRLDEEMRLAARLQQDFLPKQLPQIGRLRCHSLFRPAGYVSGDLYDVMRLDEKHVGFFVADAVGHGMPAALLTMFIKRALITKEILADGYRLLPPGEAMTKLNDSLVEQNLSQATFATALYGVIDTETHEVAFASGGHPHPVVLKPDGKLQTIEATGSLLGIFGGEEFIEGRMTLESGDRLFIYTDGVEVGFSSQGDTVDVNRWREEITSRAAMQTQDLLPDLTKCLDSIPGSLQSKDDLTMVVIEIA